MTTLTIYGKKNGGEEKVIFANLANTPKAIAQAKKTAAANGYTITAVYENGLVPGFGGYACRKQITI